MISDSNFVEFSTVQLPSLPGIRRGPLEIPPKIYSKSRPRGQKSPSNASTMKPTIDDRSVMSISNDFSSNVGIFPADASSFNDFHGRYSIRAKEDDRNNKKLSLPFSNLESTPSFVFNQKSRVCHFSAYFEESVPENLTEKSRYRLVQIIYHEEEKKFEIIEPQIRNSGLMQGKMLRKDQVINEFTGSKLKLLDFYSGADIKIYGKVYTVIDCDLETRRFISKNGGDFGDSQPFPGTSVRSESPDSRAHRANRRLFEDDEGNVLTFYGLWNDTNVQLQYVLADNTISVYEVKDDNAHGKKITFNMLLKKQRVLKEIIDGTEDETNVLLTTADEVGLPSSHETKYFIHWSDLKIGIIYPMCGMSIRLLDADKLSRKFYASHNFPLGSPIVVEKPVLVKSEPPPPPHTGFGSHEDSLTSCKGSLVPHTVRKDLAKMKQFEGIKLQFRAKLIEMSDSSELQQWQQPQQPEKPREFVIIYFMEDDQLQVLELPEKNSGRVAGNFLSKCKLHNSDGTLAVTPGLLYAGAVVTINKYQFEIYSAAEQTYQFMEKRVDIWPNCGIDLIAGKLRKHNNTVKNIIAGSIDDVLDGPELCATLTVEKDDDGYVGDDRHFKILTLQESITLVRYFSGGTGGQLGASMHAIKLASLKSILN